MRYLLCLFLVLLSFPAHAATMADLEAAVLEEDHRTANRIARDLLNGGLGTNDQAMAQYYLGLSYLRLEDYRRAQDAFNKLLSSRLEESIYDRASIGLIDALYLQGFYDKALREANKRISRRKNSEMMSMYYLKAARANLKLARWAKAEQMLNRIVSEYPNTFEGRTARRLLQEKQYFTVQVGSFSDKGRAEQLVQELIRRGEYAYVVETKNNSGKKFYRVRVGQLSALEDAQQLEAKLSGLGYPTLIYP